MKVAVVCHDIYHPGAVVRQGIDTLDMPGVEWDFIFDTTEWPREHFDTYDVILLAKLNRRSDADPAPWLTGSVQQGFVDYVESGRGLLVIHAGTVGYQDEPVFRSLVGGVFNHHPEQCDVTVTSTSPPAPLLRSGEIAVDFTVRDEHYFVDTFRDDLDVFLRSVSVHGDQPAGWTRNQGAGRVCVLTPGHNLEVWLAPQYQRCIAAALDWCAEANQELMR
jgi:hypothetical protein